MRCLPCFTTEEWHACPALEHVAWCRSRWQPFMLQHELMHASLLICAWPCRLFARASKSSRSPSSPSCRQSHAAECPASHIFMCPCLTQHSHSSFGFTYDKALRSPLRSWLPAEGTTCSKKTFPADAKPAASHGSWLSAAQHRTFAHAHQSDSTDCTEHLTALAQGRKLEPHYCHHAQHMQVQTASTISAAQPEGGTLLLHLIMQCSEDAEAGGVTGKGSCLTSSSDTDSLLRCGEASAGAAVAGLQASSHVSGPGRNTVRL